MPAGNQVTFSGPIGTGGPVAWVTMFASSARQPHSAPSSITAAEGETSNALALALAAEFNAANSGYSAAVNGDTVTFTAKNGSTVTKMLCNEKDVTTAPIYVIGKTGTTAVSGIAP